MFANFHGVNSPTMAGFKLLALQAKLEEVCTLSRQLWLQYTTERGLPAQDLCSEEMMERVCVLRDDLGSLPDFFCEIQIELWKTHFAHSLMLFTELHQTLF